LIDTCVNCILKTTYIFQAATKNVSDAISGWIFGAFAFTQFLISPVFGRLVGSFKYTSTCQNKFLCIMKFYVDLNTVRTCLNQSLCILESCVVLNTVRTCLNQSLCIMKSYLVLNSENLSKPIPVYTEILCRFKYSEDLSKPIPVYTGILCSFKYSENLSKPIPVYTGILS
jgi:hypothetical protein